MQNIKNINNHIQNLFNQSKKLSSDDFDKFLWNLETIKKNTINKRKRGSKTILFESSFRKYLNNKNLVSD